MARSFLFAADDHSSETTRLIATAAAFTGFMKGEVGAGGPGWYRPGADNAALLDALRQRLALSYPAAGPAFWGVRLWTNLTWQPAYLAVIAVHRHRALPDLVGLSQRVGTIHVDGYRLRPAPFARGETGTLIARAGDQLRPMLAAMLAEVRREAPLKSVPAKWLMAERILGLVVRLAQKGGPDELARVEDWAEQWLAALDLVGCGGLETVVLPDGAGRPIVRRKGCCLDYLVTPERLCGNCPRQPDDRRRARQAEEWLSA